MGAGMGGGSSDGVATLKLVNALTGLGLSDDTLRTMALELGSDCPFFVRNELSDVAGKGEILKPFSFDFTKYQLAVASSQIHISTAAAFAKISPRIPDMPPSEVIRNLPVSEWKTQLKNDFEPYAFAEFPQLKEIVASLYAQGALYASMTGSGSSIYGIFPEGDDLRTLSIPNATVWCGRFQSISAP